MAGESQGIRSEFTQPPARLDQRTRLRPRPPFRGEAASSNRRILGKSYPERGHLVTPEDPAESTIDKTFLIAKPMRKVDWTRRFAAGWGSAGVPMAILGGGRTVRSASARENDRGITPGARSGILTASVGARKHGTIVSLSAFQVTFPSELRSPQPGIFAEQPRPATATVGTSW